MILEAILSLAMATAGTVQAYRYAQKRRQVEEEERMRKR